MRPGDLDLEKDDVVGVMSGQDLDVEVREGRELFVPQVADRLFPVGRFAQRDELVAPNACARLECDQRACSASSRRMLSAG